MMETIKEIIAKMRKFADEQEQGNLYDLRNLATDSLRAYAALIEAAHKREQWVTNCNQLKDWRKICADCQEGEPPKDCEYYGEPDGCNARPRCVHPNQDSEALNVAKMREALETISKCDISKEEDCYTLYRVCEAALSAPPRNCDLYETEDEAWEAFCKIHPDAKCPDEYWSEQYQMWLFEQAKGE